MSSQKTNTARPDKKESAPQAAEHLSEKDLDEVAGGAGCIPPIKLPKPEPLPRPPFPDPEDPFDDRQISPPDNR